MTVNKEAPEPGWYPDPENHGSQRWWGGRKWTDYTDKNKFLKPDRKGNLFVAIAIVGAGVALSLAPLFFAALAVCGISGCSGGGFGVHPDPGETLKWVTVVAIIMSAFSTGALLWRNISVPKFTWSLISISFFVLFFLATLGFIGADFSGCPTERPHCR